MHTKEIKHTLNFKHTKQTFMNLLDLLQNQMTDGMVDQLSQQLGGADKESTAKAANGIMSTLVGALAKNASTTEGANSLAGALDRDHDGSILDDVMGLIGGSAQGTTEKTTNGTGILKHILGGKQNGAVNMISQMSGLDSGQTGNLMSMLAPMVMGALGQQKKQQGLDAGGILSLLSGTVTQQKETSPLMGLATQFLDQDGDGSMVDDVAEMGMKFLGGLFGGKK